MSGYRIAGDARADLDSLWDYIARDSEEAADRVLDSIYDVIIKLSNMPGMGRKREELSPGLYSFPVGKYVICYRSTEKGIEVARVLHSARNLRRFFPL